MSVEKDAKEYKMDHKRRGKAVIFNHDYKSNPHSGSAVDVSALTKTYKELGFEVVVHQNWNFTDIQIAITKRKFKQGVLNWTQALLLFCLHF